MDRNARSLLQQRRSHIGRRVRRTQAVEFFNVLTSPELIETTEAPLPKHRERLYSNHESKCRFLNDLKVVCEPSSE